MKWLSKKENETQKVAREFLKKVTAQAEEGDTRVVGLIGDLGAGKTTFVKFCANVLGIKDAVTSPTFVVVRAYLLDKKGIPFKKMVHVDAYRLNRENDLHVLGIPDAINEPGNLVFIEWADRIGMDSLENSVKLEFSHVNETTRLIEMSEN